MIALVTDSSAYLTQEESMRLGVKVVPHTYTVDGRPYVENFSGCNGDYQEMIAHCGTATTRQARVASFTGVFDELLRKGFDVLCVVMSSRISGAYSSAHMAAQKVASGRLAVVDSHATGASLAYLLKYARCLADQGLSLERVVSACEDFRDRVGVAFSVESMEALRNSGRMGRVRQSVNTILNGKPILYLQNGAITSQGVARGRLEQCRMLCSLVPQDSVSLTVHYIRSPQDPLRLMEMLKDRFPNIPVRLCELGPVLGIHVGLGTLAVGWQR